MTHTRDYFETAASICKALDYSAIERLADELSALRDREGRLFVVGVGGSAANAGHLVNDFRKLCGIEAYAPTDNVAELTARTNDEGWETVFAGWLKVSRANDQDALFVLSVGGGNVTHNVSVNLVRAIDESKARGLRILGIVGRDGGYARQAGDEIVIVPPLDPALVTPHSEAFQAMVWHSLSCHPKLMLQSNKWEGLAPEEIE